MSQRERHAQRTDRGVDHPAATPSKRVRSLPSETQYHLIGATLSRAEATATQAGIPVLLPTKRVRTLASQGRPPLAELIRVDLVGVTTGVLELYMDDLADLAPALRKLHIAEPTWAERYGVGAFLVFLLTCATLFLFTPQSIHLAAGVFLLTATAVAVLTSESHRRASFHRAISEEIKRRRGASHSNSATASLRERLRVVNRLQRTG